MTAQCNLDRGGKPAQFIIGLAAIVGDEEGGFGKVVLRRDGLQKRVAQPFVERHHRGGMAGEGAVGEGVDARDRQRTERSHG